jgi:TRAP-type C4-dicarboxylate transport system permease small subunit
VGEAGEVTELSWLLCPAKKSQMSREGAMDRFIDQVRRLSRFVNVIGGISLVFLMSLTFADVLLRSFKMPIPGTYELVALSSAVVIGFSLPLTSWRRGHIYVDILLVKLSKRVRDIFNLVTRFMVLVLFILIGWNLIRYGVALHKSGEVSLTLNIPFYPVAYGLGVCSFIECLVMFCDMVKIVGGDYE